MNTFKKIIIGALGTFILLLVWGLIEPYTVDVQEYTVLYDGDTQNVVTVAQISDFQVGMWWDNTRTVHKVADMLASDIQPDIVVITGDFIYHSLPNPEKEIAHVLDLLSPLTQSDIPIVAVLGNHDYGMNTKDVEIHMDLAQMLAEALEETGIEVLQNEAVQIGDLWIVGIGSRWANNAEIEKAFAGVPEGVSPLVLMHHPDTFARIPAQKAPLALSGHTHGGQIAFPFTPEWSWLTFTEDDEVHTDGWIEDVGEEGNTLYVNRGIGFSTIPIRIGAPPEIAVFNIQGQ